jgi:acetyl esterase/lipase
VKKDQTPGNGVAGMLVVPPVLVRIVSAAKGFTARMVTSHIGNRVALVLGQGRYLFPLFRRLRGRVSAKVRPIGGNRTVAVSLVTYPSLLRTGSPANDQAAAFYYQPRSPGRHPVVLILHGLGSRRASLEQWLARQFARRGLAALVPVFPDHMMRKAPGGMQDAFREGDPDRIRDAGLQAVLDLRRALDWLEAREEIAPGQVGVVGISLGAIEGVAALGLEARVKAGVLVLGGGDLARSIWSSRHAWVPLRRRFERQGITEEELRRRWWAIDPLSYADWARSKPVYMVNARFDAIILRASTEHLWEALGRPPIEWLPTGHNTASLLRRRILERAFSFLGEALGVREKQEAARSRVRETRPVRRRLAPRGV